MVGARMVDHVEEIRYAAESLVPLLWHEVDVQDRLLRESHRLEAATRVGYQHAEAAHAVWRPNEFAWPVDGARA